MPTNELTIEDIISEAEKHGGVVQGDGAGGFKVFATVDGERFWINAKTWRYDLPLGERPLEGRQALLQQCLDAISGGTESAYDARATVTAPPWTPDEQACIDFVAKCDGRKFAEERAKWIVAQAYFIGHI